VLDVPRFENTPVPSGRGFAASAASGRDELEQEIVLLAARRAPLEVGFHPGDFGVCVVSGDLELDVAVEMGKALLTGQLGSSWAEYASEPHRSVFAPSFHCSLLLRDRTRVLSYLGDASSASLADGGALMALDG
jgi:hypothetical protein